MPLEIPSDLVYDPYQTETALDPFPVFRRLREEAPLYYSAEHDFYAVSRYEDVEAGFLDHETYISGRGVTLDILKAKKQVIPPGTVIFEDPPTHNIHRSLLSRMFTRRRVSGLEREIRQMCAELLDPLVGSGGFDFIKNLGDEVPMRVIGKLVGIPEQDQRAVRDHFGGGGRDDDSRIQKLSGEIFAEYIDWRLEHPSDDIMTELLNAEFEDHTGTKRCLSREEVLAYVNIVSAAGNETTNRLIGWAGKLLAEHPEQRRILVDDPSLIPNAIEEILRFEPPPLQACRYVSRDVEVHGHTVPEGSIMALQLGAANRDDRKFTEPDSFDVRRENASQHLTFGFGVHYCLGANLARLEGRVTLEEVLKRFPEWELEMERAEFNHVGADLRGWDALPVVTP
jgi:cytochrome P450